MGDQGIHALGGRADETSTGPAGDLRKELEREQRLVVELAQERRLLEAIMHNTDAHLAFLDRDLRFVTVNETYARGSGHAAEDLIGRGHFELFPDEENERIFRRARDTGEPAEHRAKPFEFAGQPWRGVTYWDWRLTPVTDAVGEVQGLVLSLVDVTKAFREKRFSDVLNRLNDTVHSTLDFQFIVEQVMPELAPAIDAEFTAVILRSGSGEWRFEGCYGMPPVVRERHFADDELPASALAVQTGETVVVDADDPWIHEGLSEEVGVQSLLVVPLSLPGSGSGVLSFGFLSGPGSFDPAQIDFANKAASTLSLALSNARLFESRSEHARRMTVLKEVAEVASSALDIGELARRLAGAVHQLLDATCVMLALADETGASLNPVGTYGCPDDLLDRLTPVPPDTHTWETFLTGSPHYAEDDVAPGLRDSSRVIAMSLGVRASAILPLLIDGRPIGTVGVFWSTARDFVADEKSLLESIAAAMAVGLENAKRFEAERSGARINDALARIDQSIHSTLDRDEMLGRVAAESAQAIGADSTVLCLRDHDLWIVRYASNMREDMIGKGFTVAEAPFMGIAAESGQPIAIDDAFDDPRAELEIQRAFGVRAVIMAPLIVRGEVIGGLFFNYDEVHRFTRQDIQYASRLGASVGLAIANIGHYETQHDIADRLQAALLSLPDNIDGIRFAHAYQSATESSRVGGDFYDLFQLNQDHVGIVIGDVAGKGLDAAVLTSLIKNTIRAHANERGKTPAHVLELTNEVVFKATPVEAFVTVFFGILDCRDGRMVHSNAGHTTAALACNDGRLIPLPVTGPLLGAFPGVRFSQSEARMHVGDMLFLYTDGLTEARRDGEQFGEQRLFQSLASAQLKDVAQVVDEVANQVMEFAGGRLGDDLALLAVRRSSLSTESPHQQKLDI